MGTLDKHDTPDTPLSPRVRQLDAALAGGHLQALSAFWDDVSAGGAPLIEPIPNDDTHVWLTFLWRDTGDTRSVAISGPLANALGGPSAAHNQMRRLRETNLWYRTYRAPNDVRTTYQLRLNDPSLDDSVAQSDGEYDVVVQNDPLGHQRFVLSADEEGGDDEEIQSLIEMAGAPVALDVTSDADVPHGALTMRRLHSAILENTRRIWIYTPPGYHPDDEPYPVAILFDGFTYTSDIPVPTIMDNFVASGQLAPMVVLMVCNLSYEARERELPCYPPFVRFLTEELLPWAHTQVAITHDPAATIVGGSSDGGLAAIYAALTRPDVFGNVLAQSPSVYWTPPDDPDFEWVSRYLVDLPQRPVRFYVDVGRFENNLRRTVCPEGPTELAAVRHFRNLLRAKGNSLTYAEFSGGHEYVCWRAQFGRGLLALDHMRASAHRAAGAPTTSD